jgi:tripartite-type tricarboxylate transporter receptor subunit TctC
VDQLAMNKTSCLGECGLQRVHLLAAIASLLCMAALATGKVYGQTYPSKPVRFVTSEPGGGADTAARIIGRGISASLGQMVVVENRPPIIIPGETVAKSLPDGYTLLLFGGTHWLQPLLRENVPYDPIRDFAPVTLVSSSPNIMVVHPSMPVKSVKDLIALAKARPGQINYASGGMGSSNHLAAELFKAMADINVVQINYRGTGAGVNAVIAGEVQLMIANAPSVSAHIRSGRLRALAVASAQPSVLAPGLPTVTASGLPGFESVSTLGIFAPAKTPAAIINRLNQELVKFLQSPEAKERFLSIGAETVGSSPEQLETTVKAEMSRMGKVIRDANIRE